MNQIIRCFVAADGAIEIIFLFTLTKTTFNLWLSLSSYKNP